MRQNFPFWFRCLLFILVLGVSYIPIEKAITKPYASEVLMAEKVIAEQDSFDVIILSSSHGFCSFDPAILDALLEDTSTYNLGLPNLTFAHISLLLQQIIEEGKTPKVIVVETYSIRSSMYGTPQISFFNDYSKTWEPNYLVEIASYYPINDLIYPLVPIIFQHENWKSTELIYTNLRRWEDRRVIIEKGINTNIGYQNAGFRPFTQIIAIEDYLDALNHPTSFIPTEENLIALERILHIAKENDIQVIFVTAPYPNAINSDFSQFDQVIQQNGLTHYNFNQLFPEHFIPLHYLDQNHLNAHGAVNATILLADILSEETGRELLTEKQADYTRLNLAEIYVEKSGENMVVTLIPADGISEFQVDWQLKTNQDDELMSQTGGGMQFSFPAVLMNLSELDLLFTYQVPGFDYAITVKQNLNH